MVRALQAHYREKLFPDFFYIILITVNNIQDRMAPIPNKPCLTGLQLRFKSDSNIREHAFSMTLVSLVVARHKRDLCFNTYFIFR